MTRFLLFTATAMILQVAGFGLLFWVAAKICRVPNVPLRRALLLVPVAVLAMAAGIVIYSRPPAGENPVRDLILPVAGLLVLLVAARVILRARWLRTILAFLIFLGLCCAVFLPLGFAARWKVGPPFYILTGSGAPALLGDHLEVSCPSCGFRFAVGLPAASHKMRDLGGGAVECTNCGGAFKLSADLPRRTGDRIAVDLLSRPVRWNLVAHRLPEQGGETYVHRLVGLPGEMLEISGGDVFVDGKRLVKPPGAAKELWIIVHDTAYRPRAPHEDGPGWQPAPFGSRWESTVSGWRFHGPDSQEDHLEFAGGITDHYGYNAFVRKSFFVPRAVTDVRLDCALEGFAGHGGIGFEWGHAGRRVRAWLAASGAVKLTSGSATASGTLNRPLPSTDVISFAFRDGQAYLEERGRPVALLEVGPQDIEEARKIPPDAPCTLKLLASRCEFTFSRIILRREVYYRGDAPHGRYALEGEATTLGADECFVLGDNSGASADSRWRGPVPIEGVLGPVRYIFWPPGRWRLLR